MKKTILSAIIMLCAVLTTATAKDYDAGASVTLTQDTVLYAYWEVSTIEPFPTTEPVVLAGGVYKTEENKTITLAQRVRLKGTDSVTIIVAKGTTLDTKGITVTEKQTLVIETEEGAKLIADAYKVGESSYSESYAGIGGEYDNSPSSDKTCGTIEIKGKGTVIATGGVSGGAGIGGSRENDGGVITINSGNVIATGNGGGAGIGGGCGGNGGTTTFNGGTVEANGKAGGAGIGGGRKNTAAGGNGGTINIYEGAIVATGEEGGAGIGGGGNGGNSGKITVKRSSATSLTIFATGGDSGSGSGDGLGRGYGGSEYRDIVSGDFLRYRDNTTEGWKIVGPSSSGKYVRTDGAVTVKFDGNGATQGSMTDITNVTLGDTVELPKNTFTNGDKIFMGWNDRADGSGNGCADQMSFQVTKETTLYAQWATYTTMTSSDKVLEGGKAYKVSGTTGVSIAERMTIDMTSLTAEQGITVKEGQTLIIGGADDEYSYLSAELVPTEHNGAGIGSGNGTTCGTIIINGGRITATGNSDCAGIGGGNYPGRDNGTVVINGGDVTATGRDFAAGIGGGESGNGGVITINGGKVTASGQSYESSSELGGAGIGGGLRGSGGVITITGGTVTATGSMYGAGIGSGHATNPGECDGGIITITGGTVYAYGGKNGAGIGGGFCANSGTTSIKKTGEYSPVVYAMAGDKDSGVGIAPEGIGHGGSISTSSTAINLDGVTLAVSSDDTNWTPYDGSNRQRYMRTSVVLTSSITEWSDGNLYTLGSDDVTISGRVTVTGKVVLLLPAGRTLTVPKGITVADTTNVNKNKLTIGGNGTLSIPKDDENGVAVSNAGIGGDSGAPTAGIIIINGGTITVYGGGCGAGIGGGYEGHGGKISISGGTVNAFGGQGAGIGGGYNGSAGKINISGGTVNATGNYNSSGIGSGNGYTGDEGEINISNASTLTPTIVIAHGSEEGSGAGIGGGLKSAGGKINITGGTVTAYGGQNGGAGIGGGSGGAGGVITISGTSTKVYAEGSDECDASGIGKGSDGKAEGTLNISDVDMKVSDDNIAWYPYNTARGRYMKTSNY